MSVTGLRTSPAARQSRSGQETGPWFAFTELTCADSAPWLEYFTRLGFIQADVVSMPSGRRYDLQRGSARTLIREAGGGIAYDRVRRCGDYISEIGIAYPDSRQLDQAFTRAQDAGLSSPQRWASTCGGRSYYRTIEVPGGLRYSLWDASLGFGVEAAAGTAPGAMDHIALAVPAADFAVAAEMYQEAFGCRWHLKARTELPGGEAMDSGFLESGAVRITLVTPAGICRQLDDLIAAGDGQAVVQHWALDVPDLAAEVTASRARGLRWLDPPPGAYYQRLPGRLGQDMPLAELKALQDTGVLVSRTGLRQEFTAPPVSGSGFFIEGIQRVGPGGAIADGFGDDNIYELARIKMGAGQAAVSA